MQQPSLATMSCVHRQRLIEGSEEPCGHAARTFCLTARAKAVERIHVACYASCRVPISNAQPRAEAQPTTRPSSWLLVPTLAPWRMPQTLLEAKGPFFEVNFLVLGLRSRSIRS